METRNISSYKKRKLSNDTTHKIHQNPNKKMYIINLQELENKINALTEKISTFDSKIDTMLEKLNKLKTTKLIDETNSRVKFLEYTIENLTKEINDLQVHALHGSFYNNNASKDIQKLDSVNQSQSQHIYY